MARNFRESGERPVTKVHAALRRRDPPPFFPVALVLAVLLVTVALLRVNSRLDVVRLGYEIHQQAARREELVEDNRRLKMELSSLKEHRRIEKLAQEKLGMLLPRQDQIILLE